MLSHTGSNTCKSKLVQWSDVPFGGARRIVKDFSTSLRDRGYDVVNIEPTVNIALQNLEVGDTTRIEFQSSPIRLIPILRRLLATKLLKSEFRSHMNQVAHTIESINPVHVLFHPSMRIACPPIPSLSCPTSLYLQEPNRGLFEAQPGIWWGRICMPSPPHVFMRNLANHLNNVELGQSEWENLRMHSGVFCNSTFSQSTISIAYGLVPRVVHLGVDTRFFTPDISVSRENIVLCVGVSRLKQIDKVIEAIALYNSSTTVVLVGKCGDEAYVSELKLLAAVKSVDLRFVQPDDEGLRFLYRSSKFCVYVPRNEPFGLVPLEAVACGCPTLVTRLGGTSDILATGIGFPVDDNPQAIAHKLSELSESYKNCSSSTVEMRSLILRHWSLDVAADRLVQAMGLE